MGDWKPEQNRTELEVAQLKDEPLLYHHRDVRVTYLNRTASLIWSQCERVKTLSQIEETVKSFCPPEASRDLLNFGLKQLEKNNLIPNPDAEGPDAKVLSRRERVKGLGVAASLLPIVAFVKPTIALAESCVAIGQLCARVPCCSGTCGPLSSCL